MRVADPTNTVSRRAVVDDAEARKLVEQIPRARTTDDLFVIADKVMDVLAAQLAEARAMAALGQAPAGTSVSALALRAQQAQAARPRPLQPHEARFVRPEAGATYTVRFQHDGATFLFRLTIDASFAEHCAARDAILDLEMGRVTYADGSVVEIVDASLPARFEAKVGGRAPPWLLKEHAYGMCVAWDALSIKQNGDAAEVTLTATGDILLKARVMPSPNAVDPGECDALTRRARAALRRALADALPRVVFAQDESGAFAIDGSIPSLAVVQRAAKELATHPGIPHRHVRNGCEARAHLSAAMLRDWGIHVAKIFVYGMPDRLSLTGASDVTWWTHIAPLVFARDDQVPTRLVARVIDPSFCDEPLALEEWLRHFAKADVKVDVMPAAQYVPAQWDGVQADFNASLPDVRANLARQAIALAPADALQNPKP